MDVLLSEVQSIEYATSNVYSGREAGMIQRNENWKHSEKSTKWHQHKGFLIRKGRTRNINEYQIALDHPSLVQQLSNLLPTYSNKSSLELPVDNYTVRLYLT